VTHYRLLAAFVLATLAAGQESAVISKLAGDILRSVSREERPQLADLLSHGRLAEASSRLHQLAAHDADTNNTVLLRGFAARLRLEDPARWQNLSSVTLLGQLSETSTGERALFRAVVGPSQRLLGITYVSLRVKQFLYRYSLGYRNPEVVLAAAGPRMQPTVDLIHRTSRELIVTIISSGKDQDRDLLLRRTAELEAKGYLVLSYLFCETPAGRLCSDEMVGAFAGVSGHILEIRTANSQESSFVFEEADAVRRLMAGQELVTVISSEDLARAAKQTVESLATVIARNYLVESQNQ